MRLLVYPVQAACVAWPLAAGLGCWPRRAAWRPQRRPRSRCSPSRWRPASGSCRAWPRWARRPTATSSPTPPSWSRRRAWWWSTRWARRRWPGTAGQASAASRRSRSATSSSPTTTPTTSTACRPSRRPAPPSSRTAAAVLPAHRHRPAAPGGQPRRTGALDRRAHPPGAGRPLARRPDPVLRWAAWTSSCAGRPGPHAGRPGGVPAAAGVLFAGDLVFRGRIPFVGQADSRRWIDALDRLIDCSQAPSCPATGRCRPARWPT